MHVQPLAEGEAVDAELGAESGSGAGDLAADQCEFAAEGGVDELERLAEGNNVRDRHGRSPGYLPQRDHRDRAGGLGLVLTPAGVGFGQAGEDLVALRALEWF